MKLIIKVENEYRTYYTVSIDVDDESVHREAIKRISSLIAECAAYPVLEVHHNGTGQTVNKQLTINAAELQGSEL